jgi:26S proteasome regulatory subunit N13
MSDPTLDLIMFPGDGTFTAYKPNESGSETASLTNGRIYVLRFSSSSARHLFWLQSSPQHSRADFFSPRDKKIGEIVNAILQGEEVDVQHEMANLPGPNGDGDDVNMEDADNDLARATSGGAGADATGGDFREEGEESREGGEDGGRA